MEALLQPTASTKGATRGCPLSLSPSQDSDQQVVFKANVIKGADQGDFGKTEDIRSRHDEQGFWEASYKRQYGMHRASSMASLYVVSSCDISV